MAGKAQEVTRTTEIRLQFLQSKESKFRNIKEKSK
jgi:hypothetical protein